MGGLFDVVIKPNENHKKSITHAIVVYYCFEQACYKNLKLYNTAKTIKYLLSKNVRRPFHFVIQATAIE